MPKITTLGKLKLSSRVMNAAGPWSASKSDLLQLYNSNSGAVVTKTFTLKPSLGNKEPNKYFHRDYSINSVGLTNKGAAYFIASRELLGDKKPIIASITANSPDQFLQLAKQVSDNGFDALELNVSCPNVTTKEPLAYDADQLRTLLEAIFKEISIPISIKLPPFVSRTHIVKIAEAISKFPLNHLVVINTYPFATAFIEGETAIRPNNGIGGLGGSYLKPIALAHVSMFKEYLPNLPIVGVGGIGNTTDIEDFIDAGATAVQVGTAIQTHGIKLLDELASQF